MDVLLSAATTLDVGIQNPPPKQQIPQRPPSFMSNGCLNASTIQYLLTNESDVRNASTPTEGGNMTMGDVWLLKFTRTLKAHFTRELSASMCTDATRMQEDDLCRTGRSYTS